MINTMTIQGHTAVIQFDPEIDMFRGEFTGLNGGSDFYSDDVAGLREEGARSLETFLQVCEEKGIEPRRNFSGRFNVRVRKEVHEAAVQAAAARKESLNQLVQDALERALALDLEEPVSEGRHSDRRVAVARKMAPTKKKAAAKKKASNQKPVLAKRKATQ